MTSNMTSFHHGVHVREHPLPGNARLFHLPLDDGTVVSVNTDAPSTDRVLGVTLPSSDETTISSRPIRRDPASLVIVWSSSDDRDR